MMRMLMALFLKLSAKVRYVFYLFLLALGAYAQLKQMIKTAEK